MVPQYETTSSYIHYSIGHLPQFLGQVFGLHVFYVTYRYDIMLKCWQTNADERPPFSTLVVLVSTDLEHQAGYLGLSCSADGFLLKDSK